MKTDIRVLILMAVMVLRKTSSSSIDLTHQQLCVWEVCGMNPCANQEQKSCTTPSPILNFARTIVSFRECSLLYYAG